ncbi:hypothetical protein K449DRAFT_389329 [Hypoxylon sp. EC38]|nr:hypothetical protein K449DRAFT_389329 [Hypoxylon sp. EC38]
MSGYGCLYQFYFTPRCGASHVDPALEDSWYVTVITDDEILFSHLTFEKGSASKHLAIPWQRGAGTQGNNTIQYS